MDDLEDIYQEIILSHDRRPRNEGELTPRSHEADGFNPLCGDELTIYVQQGNQEVEAVQFTGTGCAISRASASIMTEAVKGLGGRDLDARIEEVIEMLTAREDPDVDPSEIGELAALLGVRKFPTRIKCATLSWYTLAAALASTGSISTQ